MNNKILGRELILFILLSLIPWHNIPMSHCAREKSTLVRKFIQKRVYPILERYGVSLPLDCPLQATRDVYWLQEKQKSRPRTSQWLCGYCGKAFFTETHLDLHFTNRHPQYTSTAEDGVCLADFCDIMRCDVLETKGDWWDTGHITDVDVWRDRNSAIEKTAPQERLKPARKSKLLDKIKIKHKDTINTSSVANNSNSSSNNSYIRKEECSSRDRGVGGRPCVGYLVNNDDTSLPQNCDPIRLERLKTKCEAFLADCIAGLVLQLTRKDYLQLEEELLLAVCWYLRCERYWENTTALVRSVPWGLLVALLIALTLATTLIYYLLWLVTEIGKLLYRRYQTSPVSIRHSSTPRYYKEKDGDFGRRRGHGVEEYFDAPQFPLDNGHTDKIILVTYPPELKDRFKASENLLL